MPPHRRAARTSAYLKHRQQTLHKRVEVAARLGVGGVKVKLAAEHLHPEESEDHDKEEQEEEQGSNGLDRVEEGGHEVGEGAPVPATRRPGSRVSRWKLSAEGGLNCDEPTRGTLSMLTNPTHRIQNHSIQGE